MFVTNKIEEITHLVESAANALLAIYEKQDLDIQTKSDATPVTEADKISNSMLREGLQNLFPNIPIISEESSVPDYSVRKKWDYVWIVDPLDGTKEFIYKNGLFCINIALIHKNIPVFGMINNIRKNEILWAFQGEKCYIKKEGKIEELAENITPGAKLKMVVSRFHITEAEFEYIDHLQNKGYTLELIPMGASAKQCEVAKNIADIYPKFGRCYEWDTAAGQVIVEATGGMVINPETNLPLEYNKENLLNPPFIMFNKKIKEIIEDGNKTFIHYKGYSI